MIELDFTPPWRRVPMMAELANHLGCAVPVDLDSEEATAFFDAQCRKYKVDCAPPRTSARLIDKLVGHFMEPGFVNPTFLIDHP